MRRLESGQTSLDEALRAVGARARRCTSCARRGSTRRRSGSPRRSSASGSAGRPRPADPVEPGAHVARRSAGGSRPCPGRRAGRTRRAASAGTRGGGRSPRRTASRGPRARSAGSRGCRSRARCGGRSGWPCAAPAGPWSRAAAGRARRSCPRPAAPAGRASAGRGCRSPSPSAATTSSILARNSGVGISVQFGPWWIASTSMCGTPRRTAIASARVVFPDPLAPMIATLRTSATLPGSDPALTPLEHRVRHDPCQSAQARAPRPPVGSPCATKLPEASRRPLRTRPVAREARAGSVRSRHGWGQSGVRPQTSCRR